MTHTGASHQGAIKSLASLWGSSPVVHLYIQSDFCLDPCVYEQVVIKFCIFCSCLWRKTSICDCEEDGRNPNDVSMTKCAALVVLGLHSRRSSRVYKATNISRWWALSVCASGPTCSASSVSAALPNAGAPLHSFHTQEGRETDFSKVKTGLNRTSHPPSKSQGKSGKCVWVLAHHEIKHQSRCTNICSTLWENRGLILQVLQRPEQLSSA